MIRGWWRRLFRGADPPTKAGRLGRRSAFTPAFRWFVKASSRPWTTASRGPASGMPGRVLADPSNRPLGG